MYPLPEKSTFKRSKMSTKISFFCLPPDCAVRVGVESKCSVSERAAPASSSSLILPSYVPEMVMGLCTAVEGVVLGLMLGMRRLGLADSTRMGSL